MKQIQIYGTKWNVGHPSESSYPATEIAASIRATTLLSYFPGAAIQAAHKDYIKAYLDGDLALEGFVASRSAAADDVLGCLWGDEYIYAFPSIEQCL